MSNISSLSYWQSPSVNKLTEIFELAWWLSKRIHSLVNVKIVSYKKNFMNLFSFYMFIIFESLELIFEFFLFLRINFTRIWEYPDSLWKWHLMSEMFQCFYEWKMFRNKGLLYILDLNIAFWRLLLMFTLHFDIVVFDW